MANATSYTSLKTLCRQRRIFQQLVRSPHSMMNQVTQDIRNVERNAQRTSFSGHVSTVSHL